MIQALRPGFLPPNSAKIVGPLLKKVAEEIENNMVSTISSSSGSIVLMQDGWSNIKNDPIIAESIGNRF